MLIAGTIVGLTAAMSSPAAAAEPWHVVLADGRRLEGTMLRTAPARYILQTATALYDLTDDDLDPQTFSTRSRQDAVPERRIHEIRHYDELHADGTATHWWSRRNENNGRFAITEHRFGFAPWEQLVADQRTWRDGFGNPLTPVYDPPREKWASPPKERVQVTLKLPVPVAPGEEWTITCGETSAGASFKDGRFFFGRSGDYAEDNLVWRKVRLPQGAKIVSVSPTPSAQFEQDGFQYVTWRRYYVKGERFPLEIVYTID
jgi:hypothetical protein